MTGRVKRELRLGPGSYPPQGSHPPLGLGDPDCAALTALDTAALLALWRRLHRRSPPPALRGELLVRALAHRLQAIRQNRANSHGALSPALKLRLRQTVAESAGEPEGGRHGKSCAASRSLRPGTRLLREWQGRMQEVTVTADGFVWRERTWRSLSAIAKAITGTSWNGWTFFGIRRSRAAKTVRLAKTVRSAGQGARQSADAAGTGGTETPIGTAA